MTLVWPRFFNGCSVSPMRYLELFLRLVSPLIAAQRDPLSTLLQYTRVGMLRDVSRKVSNQRIKSA